MIFDLLTYNAIVEGQTAREKKKRMSFQERC